MTTSVKMSNTIKFAAAAVIGMAAVGSPTDADACSTNGQHSACPPVPAPTPAPPPAPTPAPPAPAPAPTPAPAPAPVYNNNPSYNPTNNNQSAAQAAAAAAAQAAAAAHSASQSDSRSASESNSEGGDAVANNSGNNVSGNNVYFNQKRNAPGIAPASPVGAGVFGCYDKNGYAFGVSTVYKLAAATVTWSTDAKEIKGCPERENEKMVGQIGFGSDDPAKIVIGLDAFGMTDKLDRLRTPAGKADMALFAPRPAPAAPAPTSITVVMAAAAKPEPAPLPPCVIPGKHASYQFDAKLNMVVCKPIGG